MPNKITVYIDGPAKSGRSVLAELLVNGMHRAGAGDSVHVYDEDGETTELIPPPGFRPFKSDDGKSTIDYASEFVTKVGLDVDIKMRRTPDNPEAGVIYAFIRGLTRDPGGAITWDVAEVMSRMVHVARDRSNLSVAEVLEAAKEQYFTSGD